MTDHDKNLLQLIVGAVRGQLDRYQDRGEYHTPTAVICNTMKTVVRSLKHFKMADHAEYIEHLFFDEDNDEQNNMGK